MNAFKALWNTVGTLQRVKDKVISNLDNQDPHSKQNIQRKKGGEGYVMAHPMR